MRLIDLLAQAPVPCVVADHDRQRVAALDVETVASDSRAVTAGALFVAIDGATSRGTDHACAAEAAGAVAILAPRAVPDVDIPVIRCDDPRAALGPLASAVWGHPSRSLCVLGVTGTNGKTTTAILCAQILHAAGRRAAAIGTIGVWTPGGVLEGALTTPEAVDLHARLAALRDEGYEVVVMEVSSHALDQRRVDGVWFRAAAWTHLTRDHLDYHGDMDSYAAAKRRLFETLLPASGGGGFVNADDGWCRPLVEAGLAEGWTFQRGETQAQHRVSETCSRRAGVGWTMRSPGRAKLLVHAGVLGAHNLENLVAAVLLARAAGLSDPEIALGAMCVAAPPGRLQAVANRIGALALVDYAHTPDALTHALRTGRALCAPGRRLVVVFGCGGDRDRGKRGPMGRAAAAADLAIATSDNPRSEPPLSILAAVEEGLAKAGARRLERLVPSTLPPPGQQTHFLIEPDRDQAIRRAVGILGRGDVLIVAGKGHERTQETAAGKRPFDDAAVLGGWLAMHRAPRAAGGADGGSDGFAFTAAQAAEATGGHVVSSGRRASTKRLCTDTRAVEPGDLFVALRGERFDAHAFVDDAARSGAAGLVVQDRPAALALGAEDRPWVVQVGDTLRALGDLAAAHRRRHSARVVAITGSNGKTTSRAMVALALGQGAAGGGADDDPVLSTIANHNNRIGVAQTLGRLRAHHRFAVVEAGTSEPGEIAELTRMIHPDVALLTSIGEAHLEALLDLRGVAAEKASIFGTLGPNGVAIAPVGFAELEPYIERLSCRVVRYGEAARDVRLAGDAIYGDDGQLRFDADVLGHRVPVAIPGVGRHLAHAGLGALAVAAVLGVPLDDAAARLARYQPVGQRMRPLRLGGVLVLEDCYNANPASVRNALATLRGLPAPRVAVLGEMRELGPDAAAMHRAVGGLVADAAVERFVAVGAHADDWLEGAQQAGLAAGACRRIDDPVAAAEAALEAAQPGGTILIKASRGARLERVVDALSARAAA